MKLNSEEKNIIRIMILNELEFYSHKEDYDASDRDFEKKLRNILKKLEEVK